MTLSLALPFTLFGKGFAAYLWTAPCSAYLAIWSYRKGYDRHLVTVTLR